MGKNGCRLNLMTHVVDYKCTQIMTKKKFTLIFPPLMSKSTLASQDFNCQII